MPAPTRPAENDIAIRVYDDDGDRLMSSATFSERLTLLPETPTTLEREGRLRIMWGQQMLTDLLAGRYRAVVCGVNAEDNSHGIVAQLVDLTSTSQWTAKSVTSYAKMFTESLAIHTAAEDREPYILKYDLDSMLILALLRPRGRDYFTLDDLSRGFKTVTKMLDGRRDRLPVASVSFQQARSNRLVRSADDPSEPSFETIVRTMYEAGFRGDVYPSPAMWSLGDTGVFPSYPFPAGLERMREGGY